MIIWREPVQPDWIDYNGHLSEAYYVLVFGHATDEVMRVIGLGEDYRRVSSASLFTVEAHVRYLDQVSAGAELEVRSALVGAGPKKLHVWHELWVAGTLRATEEILALHVDVERGRSSLFPSDVADAIATRLVPPPESSGRRIQVS